MPNFSEIACSHARRPGLRGVPVRSRAWERQNKAIPQCARQCPAVMSFRKASGFGRTFTKVSAPKNKSGRAASLTASQGGAAQPAGDSARMDAGQPEQVHAHAGYAAAEHMQGAGGGARQVNDAMANEGAAIVD